jgi:hypothetical protein
VIVVEENTDDTQIWDNPHDGGVYTFVPLSTLSPGDRLEVDNLRQVAVVLTPPIINTLRIAGVADSTVFVRVRNATPADRNKPKKPRPNQAQGAGNR